MDQVNGSKLVGVYGGGRMGSGIAHAFAAVGYDVLVVEADADAAAKARVRLDTIVGKSVSRGVPVLGSTTVTADPSGLGEAGIVIEAVPEDLSLKQDVLRVISQAAPLAALGTNTSALSIDGLASALPNPSRLIGVHFFNPVPSSQIIEVVVGARTSEDVHVSTSGYVGTLGKRVITVKDSPGFASSRLGVALSLEAMRMVEEGVASPADIDAAMTFGYKHHMGPLRTTDIVGLDVRLSIALNLAEKLGSRFEAPRILKDKVSAGNLGRKTGEGFYIWDE